jgi:hypothetical protein
MENILAVGVCYLHVDRQLKGGALKLVTLQSATNLLEFICP